MPQRILSVEIEDTEIKAVLLEASFRDYHIAGLYRGVLTADAGPVSEQLRRFLDRNQLVGDTVVSTLPGRQVSHRVFVLPFRDRKRLNQTVPFELETQVPFGLDDAVIDYQVLRRDHAGTTVLAALVQKQDLEAHLATLSAAGIDPKIVDFAPLAAVNVLRVLAKNLPPAFAFIEFNTATANVTLCRDQQLVGVRTLTIRGTPPSTNGTGSEIDADAREQEGASPSEQGPDVHRTVAIDVRWSLMALNGVPLEENFPCFISGNPAWVEAIGPVLEREVGMDVRRLDEATLPSMSPETRAELPACAAPLGLALREVAPANTLGLNFRRGEFTYRRGQQEVRRALMRAAVLAGVLLVLAVVSAFMSYQQQVTRLAAIQSQIRKVFVATLPDERPVMESAQLQEEIGKTEQKLQLLSGIVSLSGAAAIDVLRAITEKIPNRLKIDIEEYAFDADAVRIRGKTDSFETVDSIKRQLVGLPYFQEVQVKDVKAAADGQQVTFRLILVIPRDTGGG